MSSHTSPTTPRRSKRLQNLHGLQNLDLQTPKIVSGVPASSYKRSSHKTAKQSSSTNVHFPTDEQEMTGTMWLESLSQSASNQSYSWANPPSSHEHVKDQDNNEYTNVMANGFLYEPMPVPTTSIASSPLQTHEDVRHTSATSPSINMTPHVQNYHKNNHNANSLFCIARRAVDDTYPSHDAGHMNVECPFCRALHWLDERVLSSPPNQPEFEMCCAHNKIKLPLLRVPPLPLYNLFVKNTTRAKEFRLNIVQYNASLAFTSMGVKIDHSILGRGPHIFRIQGELSHLSGSLMPEDGTAPSYAQLYIYDTQSANEYRTARNSNLTQETLNELQTMLWANNSYTHIYRHAYEVLRQFNSPDYTMRLITLPGNDPRRYNAPSAQEVGVVLPGAPNMQGDYRDIVVHLRPQHFENNNHLQLQRINEGHPAYAPLHYVLLFPFGEAGWYRDLKVANNRRRVTLLQYTAFRIQQRHEEFSTILRGGRLFQRYLVDMFACIDQERLRFIRTHQSNLRVSVLQGIEDAMSENDDRANLSQLGQRIILPSSYKGGPRDMHEQYLNGMTIARHFKKIDIFATMTANPNWPEITRELLPGQTAADRPDLVSRVFQIKKKAFLKAIDKDQIFGPCVAHVYCIEFQKRGLPHMHILIFLKEEYKLLSPESVDCLISAQWPDPVTQPALFEQVKKHMVHGPCGPLNPDAPCMKDGKCSRGYPKPFQERTTMDNQGYPLYARPNNGCAYRVGGYMLDNRWIVPFNIFLLLWLLCHFNVECAVCFISMKYVNKYMDKGGDRGTLSVYGENDEVKQYIDGRYCSASEAAWRIFQFELHAQHPNVVRLQIHLPNDQRVIFNPAADNPDNVIERAEHAHTSLTAFFEANKMEGQVGDTARRLTYSEFPQHFVLNSDPNNRQSKMWTLRRRESFALGRITYVGPAGGEKFYLRTLLMVVRGPQSFLDLRTVDGHICETFHEACLRRGLLEDDGEWRICLSDAADIQTGSQLRHLFATILLFCTPADPAALWNQFKDQICDDLQHRLWNMGCSSVTPGDIYDYGLFLIDDILQESGDFLRSLDPSSLPPSELKMKIGCPLILLRNLDPKKGLCNGTRMILLRAYSKILEVLIITGNHFGETAFIPRIVLKPSSRDYSFTLRRRQFPVRLCFAMTINKSEGQSLKEVGLHLIASVFCHGQLYVALSRAKSSHKVTVLLPETPQGRKRKTLNVVYPEVLID